MPVPERGPRILAAVLLALALAAPAPGTAGEIEVSGLRINAAPPTATVTAGYLVLENHTAHPVTLTGVTSESYRRIEIHKTEFSGGVARMSPQASLPIPAGSRVEFRPGSYHLMMFRDAPPLPEGDRATLSFHFADATTLVMEAGVTRPQARHQH